MDKNAKFDIIDDIVHVSGMEAVAQSFHIRYNDSRFNHAEFEYEINAFMYAVNKAVRKFQGELKAYNAANINRLTR